LRSCEAIITDFCVDDYLGGASTKETALQLRNDLIKVTRKAGFELRKWVSNDKELLNDMPNEDNTQLLVLNLKNDVTKILGLIWNTPVAYIGIIFTRGQFITSNQHDRIHSYNWNIF